MLAFAPLLISLVSIVTNAILTSLGHNDPSTQTALLTIAGTALGAHAGNQKGTL